MSSLEVYTEIILQKNRSFVWSLKVRCNDEIVTSLKRSGIMLHRSSIIFLFIFPEARNMLRFCTAISTLGIFKIPKFCCLY